MGMELVTMATSAEVAAEGARVAVLPIGSYEQHGAYLPLATDTIVACAIAKALAEAYPLFLLPPVTFSCSHEHASWPGTVSISATTLISVIADVRESLRGGGNGHEDMHAGELETSILLHAFPGVVREGNSAADHEASDRDHLLTLGMRGYTQSGVIGRPSLGTADKGKAILESLVTSFADQMRLLTQPREDLWPAPPGEALRQRGKPYPASRVVPDPADVAAEPRRRRRTRCGDTARSTASSQSSAYRLADFEWGISAITLGELRLGVLQVKDPEAASRRLSTYQLAQRFEELTVDEAVSEAWALLVSRLRAAGRNVPINDSWIAATAIVHRVPIVTQDSDYDAMPDVRVIKI